MPRRMRLFGLVVGTVAILITGAGVMSGEALGGLLKDGVSWLALGAFWYWVGPALLKASVARQLRYEHMQESRETERLTFSAAGFSPSDKWPQPMPWSFVDRVIETRQFFLIHHGYSKDPFYVPKHALSAADQERLFALLKEYLK